ncbi:MAG: amidinotransferase [Candidatus Omnitrophica bacterium]|nr:amidinotransferase [Candidatus Omnitrophota bacterium]
MCRPTHYTIAYEINPWMRLTRQTAHDAARRQWQQLYRLLTHRLRARVRLIRPVRGLPDLVFTANAGLVADGVLIRSNFRFPERQGEEAVVEGYFQRHGYQIVRLPRRVNFEGEGDAVWIGSTLLLGFRFRSDATVHERLGRLLRCEVLPVELRDQRFYHLDTCFCPLGPTSAVWYPRAFDRYGCRVIASRVPDTIAVSEADALRFCCNSLVIGRDVVMPAGVSNSLTRRLGRRGWVVHEVELSEFLKAGGAAKCLVLRLT